MPELSIGFSPCPNDTFIFDALVHKKVDTEGLDFKVHLADVEELNQLAFEGKLDVTKLSYHAFLFLRNEYLLLNSGSALGKGVGPLLISNRQMELSEIEELTVAIPGKYTTANLLLSLAYPKLRNKKLMLFSDIEEAVLNGSVDLGVIIHENRFTYESKGLYKMQDLGEFWEKETGKLIPLGGIVCRRSLDHEVQQKLDRIIRRSIEYAYANPASAMGYILENSQEMEAEIVQKHIELYVNNFSIRLGKEGKEAVEALISLAEERGLVEKNHKKFLIA